MKNGKRLLFTALIFGVSVLSSCSSSSSIRASEAVEEYLQALVDRDLNRMITASCPEWEAQAKVEFDSFAAVKLTLENLDCKTFSEDQDGFIVSCSGSITANYGAEDLVIDIADRKFLVVSEQGEAKMCGYSSK